MVAAQENEYVAVGSSFAAGPGLTPRVAGSPRAAGRSTLNYAHLLAQKRGLELRDVTYSGATTANLLGATGDRVAQLDAVTATTRLVTITAGGNDVGYIGGLTMSSAPAFIPALLRARGLLAGWLDRSTFDERFQTLGDALRGVVQSIRDRAPEATIVFVDYLTILPSDPSTPTPGLPTDVAEWGRMVSGRMTQKFRDISAAEGALFVPVGERSQLHHAWSDEPWTRHFKLSLRGGAPYHPTAAGMTAVADMLDRALPPG